MEFNLSGEKIAKVQKIAMLGVGGAGMKGLAYLLSQQGKIIMGADASLMPLAKDVNLDQVTLISEQAMTQRLSDCDLLIYSDAITVDHQVRSAAKTINVPELCFNEAVGILTSGYETYAVTGTHGKSSTAAMLARIFMANHLDPTVLVGAAVPDLGGRHAQLGQSKYFIVEADEYREHFLTLSPTVIIITAIDFDHPDYFSSITHVASAFNRFLRKIKAEGAVFTPKLVKNSFPELDWPKDTVTPDPRSWPSLTISLPGQHMLANAALAIAAAGTAGVTAEHAIAALRSWRGVGRRTEIIGQIGQMTVLSDYGHHPTEIAATLRGLRTQGWRRILSIVEIHTLGRLQSFQSEFAAALQFSDGIIFTPVFAPAGREEESAAANVLLEDLSKKLAQTGSQSQRAASLAEAEAMTKKMSTNYDLTIIFSAGQADGFFRTALTKKKQ